MIDIKHLELAYFQFGKPYPYKLRRGGEVLIHPINVQDYFLFTYARSIMEIKKNEIGKIEYIKMSYLEFLTNVVFKENDNEIDKLYLFLSLVLNEKYFDIIMNDNEFCVAITRKDGDSYYLKHLITSKELEEIARISLYQNDIDYDDTYYNPEIRAEIEKYYKAKYGSNTTSISFEKQLAYVISKTGWTMEYICQMTYRLFNFVFKACIDSEIYLANTMYKAGGNFEIKEDIKHPLYQKKKTMIEEVFMDRSELDKKIH